MRHRPAINVQYGLARDDVSTFGLHATTVDTSARTGGVYFWGLRLTRAATDRLQRRDEYVGRGGGSAAADAATATTTTAAGATAATAATAATPGHRVGGVYINVRYDGAGSGPV